MTLRRAASALAMTGLLAAAAPAGATGVSFLNPGGAPPSASVGRVMSSVSFLPPATDRVLDLSVDPLQSGQTTTPPKRPVVFEYSEGYQTRLKIHKIASLATIPLFVAEGVVGQSLYNAPTAGKRTAHLWIATGIGVLFGVNTVTGVWNLSEAKGDPNGRARRLTHSILMLAADVGFFATAVTGPGHHMRNPSAYDSQRSLHRNLAYTSITLASIGYAVVLFPHH